MASKASEDSFVIIRVYDSEHKVYLGEVETLFQGDRIEMYQIRLLSNGLIRLYIYVINVTTKNYTRSVHNYNLADIADLKERIEQITIEV